METFTQVDNSRALQWLRPMGIGDLLDRVVYFYRIHFVTLVSFVAILTVPLNLLNLLFSLIGPILALLNLGPTIEEAVMMMASLIGGLGSLLIGIIMSSFIYPLQVAGIGIAMRGFLLEGRRVSLKEIFATLRQNLSSLFAVGILGTVLFGLMMLTWIIPPVGLAAFTLYTFAFFLGILIVQYEGQPSLQALRRGWLLVSRNPRTIVQYMILSGIFSLVFILILIGLTALSVLPIAAMMDTGGEIFFSIAYMLAILFQSVLLAPLYMGMLTLLYFDLRVRHEGLDVALAAAEAAGEPLDLAAVPLSEGKVFSKEGMRGLGTVTGIYTLLLVLGCGCFLLLPVLGLAY